ncbi:MAG: TetR/AcrR family transcriptional regulator [Actinomycetota bacterium]|nr:TetR/AcrR family transcriptional regulator [Actinomycetota bacterium]
MELIVGNVKSKRRYKSRVREDQARRTRETILRTAQRQFLGSGYAATTIAAIAAEAGVSVDTIYKTFGGKPGLVRAIYERGLKGRGSVPAYQRSEEIRMRESDPRTIMRKWGRLAAEVGTEVTPIQLLVRSAAGTDPDAAALLKEIAAHRLKRMRDVARFLADRDYLRDGVSVAQAADVMWTCTSAELYELLVLQRGWSLRRFGEFVADFMISALLPKPINDSAPVVDQRQSPARK